MSVLATAARASVARHARKALLGGRASGDGGGDHGKDRDDKQLNWLWRQQAKWDLATRIAAATSTLVPGFEHAISVAVVGGPEADMRRIWYLAVSAAFGRYRNRIRAAFNNISIQAQWDITAKAVTLEISYQNNALVDLKDKIKSGAKRLGNYLLDGLTVVGGIIVGRGGPKPPPPPLFPDPAQNVGTFLHRGPEQLTIGGSWPDLLVPGKAKTGTARSTKWIAPIDCADTTPFNDYAIVRVAALRRGDVFREFPLFNAAGRATFYPYTVMRPKTAFGLAAGVVLAGVPLDKGMPLLPDEGRVITTAEKGDPKVQPPAPALDGNSRSNLLAIVSQSLHDPCHLPVSPGCTATHAASSGSFVADPGTADLRDHERRGWGLIAGSADPKMVVRPEPIPAPAPNFRDNPNAAFLVPGG